MNNDNLTTATAPVDVATGSVETSPAGSEPGHDKKKGTVKSKKEDATMTATAKSVHETPHAKLSDIVFPDYEGRAAPRVIDKNFLEDLRVNGIINPLTVQVLENGKFEIIAGRGRARAAKELGLKTVPIRVVHLTDDAELGISARLKAEAMALSENLERLNLNAWDLFMQFTKWAEAGLSQTQMAKMVHRTDGFVSQHLGIGKLPPAVRNIVKQNAPETAILSKVRELLKLSDYPEKQLEIAKDCFSKDDPWTFAQLKEHIEDELLKIKEQERQKAQKEREKAKEKRTAAEDGAVEAAGEGETEGGDESVADVEDDPYAEVEIQLAGKKITRSMLSYLNTRLTQAKLLPEESDEAKLKKMLKIEFERGRLEGVLMVSGQKSVPKSVLKAAGVEE